MKSKGLISLLLAGVMVAGLVGCGETVEDSTSTPKAAAPSDTVAESEESSQEEAKEEVTVTGKVTMVTTGIEYAEIMDAIKEDLPGVDFTWEQQGSSTFENAYKTRLAAGAEGMDIFTPARADYPVLASAGQLLDITGEAYLDNYTDGVISSAEVDGKVYGIPITANCYIVWYNKEAFEQCGLTQPTTFEELEADCAVLKENGIVPLVAYPKSGAEQLAALFFHDLLSKNPEWLDQLKTGDAKWTDEEAVAALAKLEEWVDNGYILDGSLSLDDTQAYQAFFQGQAAMLHNGTWSIDKIAEAEPEFEYGVFPYLAKEGTTNRAQYCPGNIWTIAAESSDVEAAKAVFNWISQPENAQLYCRTAKQFGTVKGISFDFHEAAEDITPFYEMDKTKMMHAYLTPFAKSELATQVQRLIAKDETQTTAEKAAAALQIAQDNDNKN